MKRRGQSEHRGAKQPPGEPPADPRGEHHRPYARRTELERLCLIASRRRVGVALTVTRHMVETGHERERRHLRSVVLYAGGVKIASERIRGGRRHEAANLLLPRLAASPAT